MRIVAIVSAGASALFEAANACPHVEFACITDRDCAAERTAKSVGMRHERIEEPSNEAFSAKAAASIGPLSGCDAVIALYSRVMTPPLVGGYPMLNIHPSLLPDFPGLGALAAAKAAGAAEFGATLHGLTMRVDQGPIVAQVRAPLERDDELSNLEKKSFVQKLYLILLAIDLLETGALRFERGLPVCMAGPRLTNARYVQHVNAVQLREGVRVL